MVRIVSVINFIMNIITTTITAINITTVKWASINSIKQR